MLSARRFSHGLQTGQLVPLIREFQLGDEAVQAASAGDMEAFVKALQKNVGEKKAAKEEEGWTSIKAKRPLEEILD